MQKYQEKTTEMHFCISVFIALYVCSMGSSLNQMALILSLIKINHSSSQDHVLYLLGILLKSEMSGVPLLNLDNPVLSWLAYFKAVILKAWSIVRSAISRNLLARQTLRLHHKPGNAAMCFSNPCRWWWCTPTLENHCFRGSYSGPPPTATCPWGEGCRTEREYRPRVSLLLWTACQTITFHTAVNILPGPHSQNPQSQNPCLTSLGRLMLKVLLETPWG